MDAYTLQMSFRQMSNYLCGILKQRKPKILRIKLASMQAEEDFWEERFETAKSELEVLVKEMKQQKFKIIITKKEEVIALTVFFAGMEDHKVSDYRVVNTDEIYLEYFPIMSKFYKDFFFAYNIENDEDMKKVYCKYIEKKYGEI